MVSQLAPDTFTEIVRRIRSVANPRKIVLFGGRARGEHRPESDIDLLVIEDSPSAASSAPDPFVCRSGGPGDQCGHGSCCLHACRSGGWPGRKRGVRNHRLAPRERCCMKGEKSDRDVALAWLLRRTISLRNVTMNDMPTTTVLKISACGFNESWLRDKNPRGSKRLGFG